MKRSKIAIIGAGCCGLFLANLLSKENVDVFMFEKNNKLGKKILASGNGKCNFTNLGSFCDKYNNKFANEIINDFNVDETLKVFTDMGLLYKKDVQDRCYPLSECSMSVLDCLKMNISNVHILMENEIKNIVKTTKGYILEGDETKSVFDYVICCSGSSASNLGSLKAYNFLRSLDIKMNECKASLAPVKVREKVKELKGLRIKCLAKLISEEGSLVYEENGEVLFKEDALSGIAVFNMSSFINRKNQNYKIMLDLSSGMSDETLKMYFLSKKNNPENIFKGYLNDKLGEYILRKNNIQFINDANLNRIINDIKGLSFDVVGVYPLVDGQVCSGGVLIEEVTTNLELKKYENVYVGGELLDVDGVSGGYNMQFAWSCAGVIAKNIRNKINNN